MMKHLIKDSELMAYIEGKMSREEEKALLSKLKDNGEMETLYHLREAWLESMADFAETWIGKDEMQQESRGHTLLAAKDKLS